MLLMNIKHNFLLLLAICIGGGGETTQGEGGTLKIWIEGGASAPLTCRMGEVPTPGRTVTWLAADFTPLQPNPTLWRVLNNGSLYIHSSATSNDGTFRDGVRCRANIQRGALVSPPFTLNSVSTEVTATVEASAVRAGGIAALRCVLPPSPSRLHPPPPQTPVRWWRNNVLLQLSQPTSNARYVSAGQRGEWLLFDGASTSDHYSCQLDGAAKSEPTLLRITESLPSGMPRLAVTETEIQVLAGSNLCLPCAAPDYPPPHYTWYRETGGRLQAAEEGGSWRWREGAALCFSRVTPADAGTWLCRASTARGDATARIHLQVRRPLTITLSPPLTVAGSGTLVRLECQTNDPDAIITWLHMGAPVVIGDDVTAISRSILQVRVTSRTRGLWQCEAKRGWDIEQASAELRLADALPELRYTFIEQALRPGARVSLRCVAVAEPTPTFTWLRDYMPLQSVPDSHRYSVGMDILGSGEAVTTLNISSVATEDSGLYTCRAQNQRGKAQHSARLNIYGPPLVRAMPPFRALVGANVTLVCPYAGYPISSVTWQRSDKSVRTSLSDEGRVRVRGALLELWPALEGDAGRYSCAATGPGGASATRVLQLVLLNPPKISPFVFSSELSEGNSVRVICSIASGDRPYSFSWLKDGAPIPPELQIQETSLDDFSLLKFGELRERHSGDYTCRVTNHAASVDYTATLYVKASPTWTREPLDSAVAVGAPLRVECEARGQPPPAVTWHRRPLCDAPAPCEWRPLSTNGTLWASAATRDLAGLYRCTAYNGVGPALHKHVNITVYEPAHVESSNDVVNVTCVQAISAACVLSCVTRGDEPLTVTWIRAAGPLDMHSGRVSVSESRGPDGAVRSALTVRALTGTDAGEYRCRASNQRGRSERLLILHVEEPPLAPTSLRVDGRDAQHVRIAWRVARALRYSALLEQLRARTPQQPVLRDLILDSSTSDHGSCEDGWSCAVLSGLRPGAAYSVRVRASSLAGDSPLSAPLLFTTLEDAPARAPQDVRVRNGDSAELHLTWSPPAVDSWNGELLGYVVSWRAVDAKGVGRLVRRGVATTVTLTSLRPRTQYAFTVRAFNRAGIGPLSPIVLAFTSDGELEAPTSVRCSSVSSRDVRVLWTPDDAHAQYQILYAPALSDLSTWSEEEELSVASWRGRQVTAAGGTGGAGAGGLCAATNYSVWVRARNGPSAAPAHCATQPAAPSAVRSIDARGIGSEAVRVWWKPPADCQPPTHYTLYTRDLVRSEGEWSLRVEGSEEEPARVVTGLRKNSRYEFWVRAHSSAGAGPPSPRVPAAPTSHTATEAARVWSFPRVIFAAVGARVRLPCAAGGTAPLRRRWAPLPYKHLVTATGELHILGIQLEWAGNYTCTVGNALGVDSVTHTVRTRPAPEPPPTPPAPRVTCATAHDIHLTWDPVTTTFPPLLGYTIKWEQETTVAEVQQSTQAVMETGAAADDRARTLRGLACGARYRITMRAHNARGASEPSQPLLAATAGHAPVPAAAGDFVWANSTALRLLLVSWDAPCVPTGWRLALRPRSANYPAIWTHLPVPSNDELVVEVGSLIASVWYEVQVTAEWEGGVVTALYRAATLNEDGERIGDSELLQAEVRGVSEDDGFDALLPTVIATSLTLLAIILAALVWRTIHQGKHAVTSSQDVPPPPRTLDRSLPNKCDISDISVMSVRISRCDSGSDSSGERVPCVACQRSAPPPPPAPRTAPRYPPHRRRTPPTNSTPLNP